MKTRIFTISVFLIFAGCGGGDGGSSNATSSNANNTTTMGIGIEDINLSTNPHPLKAQMGTQSYLFYGDVNPKSLGSLSSVRVIDLEKTNTPLLREDRLDVRYPVVSTQMKYSADDMLYENLYVNYLSFVSNGRAFVVEMEKRDYPPMAYVNSSAKNLTNPSYETINYFGTKQYLIAQDDKNRTLLITPDMRADDEPIDLGDREFITVTYQAYGEPIDGYLLYNNKTKMVQKCNLDVSSCVDVLQASSRDFEGDTTEDIYSAFLVDGKLYRVNKATGESEEISLNGKRVLDGHGTVDFNRKSFYFVGEDANLYRVNISDKRFIRVTNRSDERIERIRGFTNNWVIYGSDTILMASKKDGSSNEPVYLAETTQTKGYKYVTNYGVGDDYLFVTYKLLDSGDTKYRACIFNNGDIKCRDNSFWAGVSASKYGKLNFSSSYFYTPYAYIRVDNTDNFGGGTLKAIDPKYPLDEGLNMGSVPKYNFQTFLTNSRYINETIDSEGGVVFFAKNDTNFHVDSFYMNLLKENSLKQLTNTDPVGISEGRDHCHGRHCMICHNLAGGKIYKDKKGTKSAYGYRVKVEFEDGSTLLADVAKGAGENFSMPIESVVKNFKPMVIDGNGSVLNSASDYNHYGVEYSNCNFCHGRYGKSRYDAPGAITIEPIE